MWGINRDRVALLGFVLVSLVVIGTWATLRGREDSSSCATELYPVGDLPCVNVGEPAIYHQSSFPSFQAIGNFRNAPLFTFQTVFISTDRHFLVKLRNEYAYIQLGFPAFKFKVGNLPIPEDYHCRESGERFSFRNSRIIDLHIQGDRAAVCSWVFSAQNDPSALRSPVGQITSFEGRVRDPRSISCGIGRFFGRAPQQDICCEQSESNKGSSNLQSILKDFVFPLLLVIGFFLIRWGLGWWNGIYSHPNGRSGEYLATLSYFIGGIVWMMGFIGFLTQIGDM